MIIFHEKNNDFSSKKELQVSFDVMYVFVVIFSSNIS